MKGTFIKLLGLAAVFLLFGCGNYHRHGLDAGSARRIEGALSASKSRLPADLERKILGLDPNNVTAQDVRGVLSHAPAPRVVNIHGGEARVIPRMVNFSEFLIGMGYPAVSLTNPSDGTYSFSCYESSAKIAGAIAWFYEREGLRPMMVGHSQGGMQVVKILDKLAAKSSRLHVWNPLTWEEENRCEIVDPLTGRPQPVAGLRLPYATVVGAGGITRILPNQWDMTFRLHTIPDSIEEFTGFCKGFDFTGGDFLGYGSINHYKASGSAVVRSVWLPSKYRHGQIPNTKHLLGDPKMVDWINGYRPAKESVVEPKLDVQFNGNSSNIIWAAEVWYSIKKHWALELQRLILARRENHHER